ncbi:MAG: vWA domain-containing protein [Nitrososphaerota archaeon]
MKDPEGKWVTGLSLNDFSLSEALLDSKGNVIQELPITFVDYEFGEANSYYQFYGDGFWERSVTDEKLDIVFLVDMTGSMEDEMPGIHSELHEFVDRLLSEHVDFRMAVVKYEGSTVENSPAASYTNWAFTMPFRGTMEAEEIHQWLDNVQLSGGEWWDPAASYDQLMLVVSEFDFRKDARKVIVIITDSPAKSVYGTFWYAPDCSAATLSAVELFLKDKGFEILYSQPEKLQHLKGYFDANINPKAMAGFETFGTRISWPFQQEDIKIKSDQIVESQYFFAWKSQLNIPGDPHNYTVRVTIKAIDPSRSSEWVECSFSYVPYQQTAKLMINVYDEGGNPTDDVWLYFYREMGDRKICTQSQEKPKNGLIFIDRMPIGNYYLITRTHGNPVYSYETLRYEERRRIEIPAEGLNFTLRVKTGEREMELAKARGLLKDLDEYSLPDNPFKDFVAEAEKWLNELEADGITWQEMVAIKRFYVALSGYANFNEYAQRELENAIKDFMEIIKDIYKIIRALKGFAIAREMSFKEILAAAVLELAYDILTGGRFTAAKEAVEKALVALVTYIRTKLISDLVKFILEQIPDMPYKSPIIQMISDCIELARLHEIAKSENMSQVEEEEMFEKKLVNEIMPYYEKVFIESVFKVYYIDRAKTGLYAALESAKSYVPQGENYDDWEEGMFWDFYEYREIVDSIQDTAWNALKTQEDIENWANMLKELADILDLLAQSLDTLGGFYPPFEDEAKAVHKIVIVLDGIQIIPRAIEFGLEVDCIYTLGDKAEVLSYAAFGKT